MSTPTPAQPDTVKARCPYCRNNPGLDIRDGVAVDCPDCDGTAWVAVGSRAYAEGVEAGLILEAPR